MTATKHKTGSANPKVYEAILNQTTIATSSGLLVVGKSYIIMNLVAGDNFTNVGYVQAGLPFVATGTTPTVWTNSTSVTNMTDSAPIPIILDNTLGNIVWSYTNIGSYVGTLTGAFVEDLTTFLWWRC